MHASMHIGIDKLLTDNLCSIADNLCSIAAVVLHAYYLLLSSWMPLTMKKKVTRKAGV
jgi:hypothetical protein